MESKKQFVLVPPMTEPLNKLNEVYESNSEENAEISIIDDLRELNQFVAITGQCLVVFSNPKKCANFLQENRAIINKSHCKIILISPLDIPAATLTKFTKAGLTESILESSTPKKIIYKISLHLRSLKNNQLSLPQDQIVKSLIDTNPHSSNKAEIVSESKIKAQDLASSDAATIQKPVKERKEVKERDIFQNLKGKTNYKEESIDTKWKTERDTLKLNLEKSDSTKNSENTTPDEKIDNYIHGKSEASGPEIINKDEFWDGLVSTKEEAIEDKIISKIDLGTSLDIEPASKKEKEKTEEEKKDKQLKRSEEIELDLEKPKKDKPEAPHEEANATKLGKKTENEKPEEKKDSQSKKREPLNESIGGYLKGKFNKAEDEAEVIKKPKENVSAKEEAKPAKKKIGETVLDIFGEMKAKRAKAKEEKQEKERKARDAASERINGHYKSKEDGSVENIETTQFGSYFVDESKKIETYESKERKKTEASEEQNPKKKKNKIDLGLEDAPKAKKTKDNTEVNEEYEKEPTLLDEDSENSLNDIENSNNDPENSETELAKKEKKVRSLSSQVELELIDGDKPTTSQEELEEKTRAKREFSPYVEKAVEQNIHEGRVDKIDKYLRSPENKKEEQDWSKIKKSKMTSLLLEKSKKIKKDEIIEKTARTQDEQIIDYRKIKEAFAEMNLTDKEQHAISNSKSSSAEVLPEETRESHRMNEITLDTKGFDFSIRLLNQIYAREYKASDLYEYLTKELINNYSAYPIFFSYDPNTEKFNIAYSSIEHKEEWGGFDPSITEWWKEYASQEAQLHSILSKNITAWMCRSLSKNHPQGNAFWEDSQLPSWASQELSNKMVELVYPFYDGLELMGTLLICFPFGVEPKFEYNYYTIVEMARAAQMDLYYQLHKKLKKDDQEEASQKKSGFLDNLFGKKKAS